MPITHAVDRDARLIRAWVTGDFTAEEMIDVVTSAGKAAGEAGFNIISDHREIGQPATRMQVELLVAHLEHLRRYFSGSRWAIIVSSPASFGMARMLGAMAERVPMTVRAFREAEPAERWVNGGPEPQEGHDGDASW
ncbi:MAG: hypothetical protein JWO05_744 [Gemmatimonadetes bacterium]|nr:hypothetical protein [Gemmatimonadota bacterium]